MTTTHSARQRLLDAAEELFYTRGINATGVDAVIEEAGVARMTFYKHFRGKDALIVEYLQGRDARWQATLTQTVADAGEDPKDRLMAIFDALRIWNTNPRFRGCSFINAIAELSDPEHPAREVVAAHKREFRDYVAGLARAAGCGDRIVDQLMLLFEGATATQALGTVDDATDKARELAERLIEEN